MSPGNSFEKTKPSKRRDYDLYQNDVKYDVKVVKPPREKPYVQKTTSIRQMQNNSSQSELDIIDKADFELAISSIKKKRKSK